MSKSIKLNIAWPLTGGQKSIQIDDEQKLRPLFDKRIAMEVSGDDMGPEFKGYTFRISGGNDRQGFPMMQGVMSAQRVRLLLGKDSKCFRERRSGMRKRKSVRGCIVNHDMSVINLVVVKKGDEEIPGVTDVDIPRRHGPKRAANIRKLFNLEANDDVRQFVVRRTATRPEGKGTRSKAPKIMRLVTPQRRQRKRAWAATKRQRWEKSRESAKDYATLVAKHQKELREARAARRATRRSTRASASA